MDDETSSRIRDAVRDAVLRGRPPADTEAAKQQMLISTLRLAGHTVELAPALPASPSATDPPDDTARAGGAEGPDETLAAETLETGNPLVPAGLDRAGDRALSPSSEAQAALPSNSLEIVSADEAGSSAGSVDSAADGTPPSGDGPPVWSIVAAGDQAETARSPAPGPTVAQPDPGAGCFFISASATDNESAERGSAGDEGTDRGGDGLATSGSGGAPGEGGENASQPAIVVEPTEILTEQLVKAAAESVLPLAQKAVDEAMSDLRHEMFVSRAAWNALFPR